MQSPSQYIQGKLGSGLGRGPYQREGWRKGQRCAWYQELASGEASVEERRGDGAPGSEQNSSSEIPTPLNPHKFP